MDAAAVCPVARSPESKTLALVFFGLVKNVTARQLAAYDRWLLRPWRAAGWTVVGVMHTHRMDVVSNARNRERDVTLHQSISIAAFRNLVPGLVVSVTEGPDSDKLFVPASMIRTHPHWKGPGEITTKRNFIRQLHSMQLATRLAKEHAPAADAFIYLRPDVMFLRSCAPFTPPPRAIVVPKFHSYGGYNDRLAICGRESFEIYGNRFDLLGSFLKGAVMHAETFLKWVLGGVSGRVVVSENPSLIFVRIRGDGLVAHQDSGIAMPIR